MNDNIYTFYKSADHEYNFVSVGRRGTIKKILSLEEMSAGIYNVLLQDEVDGERLGDMTVSDNGDPLKVINTAAAIIRTVLAESSVRAIHIAGSTEQRNFAYQRRIMRELQDFIVLGQKRKNGPFEPVGESEIYRAFLVLPE